MPLIAYLAKLVKYVSGEKDAAILAHSGKDRSSDFKVQKFG